MTLTSHIDGPKNIMPFDENTKGDRDLVNIPLVNLKAQYDEIKGSVNASLDKIFKSCDFILGQEVLDFEAKFAEFIGTKFCVGVGSGTDALHLACRAIGLGSGDEVIVPANTFIATCLGVELAGAKPIPVDVDSSGFLMDNSKIRQSITKKTKAIIPVHLYGQVVDMTEIRKIASEFGLTIIEDAAQAHGAMYGENRAGSLGKIGCFSFYPGKNLGGAGDGGALTTNCENTYQSLLGLRNYGSTIKYHHPKIGVNSRLDSIQAAILNIKLKKLDYYNNSRRKVAKFYLNKLKGIGDISLPFFPEDESHVFHLFVIKTSHRKELAIYLARNGIGTGIHYPKPFHLHGAFKHLGYEVGSFPVSEKNSEEIISLPIYPELRTSELEYIVEKIVKFYN